MVERRPRPLRHCPENFVLRFPPLLQSPSAKPFSVRSVRAKSRSHGQDFRGDLEGTKAERGFCLLSGRRRVSGP